MSASVIDALVVTLGLDGAMFKRGIKDANDEREKFGRNEAKWDKEREQANKKAVDGYRSIRNELLSLAAIFTAGVGIKSFITDTINSAANLGYLSQNLRMSTQDLTSWQRASERAGGSAGGIVAQLKESADTLAQLRSGFGPNEGLQNFFRFGGSAGDLKDGNSYLLARSRIIHDLFAVDPSKAALVAKSMGVSEDQFNFLKQGPDAVMALVQAQEKNASITDKNAADALAFKNRMLDLRDSLQTTAIKLLVTLLPAFSKFVGVLDGWAQKLAENKDVVAGWAQAFVDFDWKSLAEDAKSFAADIRELTKDIRDLIDRWDEWTGKPRIKTPGVTYLPGAIKSGKKEDIAADAAARGEKIDPSEGKPKNPTLAKINDALDKVINMTLASFGVQRAKELIRDQTGVDSYSAGPKGSKPGTTVNPADADLVRRRLESMGWSKEQAAGITASFIQESSLLTNKPNPKSGAYGIGQWLAPRRADFKKWAGHDIYGSSLDEQLKFFQYEVTQGKEKAVGDRLRAAKSAEEVARLHSELYERPGAGEANIARRQRLAAQLAAGDRAANARAVGAMPATAAAGPATASGGGAGSTSTTEVHIDTITVNTQATDAQGVATALRPAIGKYTFPTQANTGLR